MALPLIVLVPLVVGGSVAVGSGIGYAVVSSLRSTREEYTGNDKLIVEQIDKLITKWNTWVKSKDNTVLAVASTPSILYTPTESPARNDLLMDYWIMRAALASQDSAFIAFYDQREKEYEARIGQGKMLTQDWAKSRYDQALAKFARIAKDLKDPSVIRKSYTTLQYLANPSAQAEQEQFNTLQRVDAWDDFVVPTFKDVSRPFQLGAALYTGKRPPFLTEAQWRVIQFSVYGTVAFVGLQTLRAYLPTPPRRYIDQR
jgi:hypothetical protein